MLKYFFLNNFDQQIATLFLANRTDLGIKIFAIVSFFGNWQFLLPVIFIICLTLFIKNRKRFVAPFLLTVGGAEVITFLGKILFHRPRPLYGVFQETDFSFPSGHATIAVAFYGYLAYLLIKLLKDKYKLLISILAILIAGLIGFSRLYLGVHYASDVLAGYFVGSLALVVGIIWTEKLLKNKNSL